MTAEPPPSPTLISVVVTCYNLERYIGEAIASVLEQSDPGALEIIVVDDCSTDGSMRLIEGFVGVRLVRTERNCGVMLAMVAGVEVASGDIICLLDGDDVWESGKLAAVRRCFDEDPAVALVTHDLTFIDERGRPTKRRSLPAARISAAKPSDRAALVRKGILELDDYVWLGSALCIRRSLAKWDSFAALARSLPDPRNTYQDWPLAYWIAAQPGVALDYVAEPLFRYRLHGSNHSGDASTVARAARNFERSRNTSEAMVTIGRQFDIGAAHQRAIAGQSAFYAYLTELYSGARVTPGSAWRALAFVRQDPAALAREVARYSAIQLLGPDRFLRITKRSAKVAR